MKASTKSFLLMLAIYVGLVLFEWYLDDYYLQCDDLLGRILMVVHHAIVIFHLLCPFLFGLYWYHLIVSLFVIGGWYVYGHCILTEIHNTRCNIEDTTKHVNLVSHLTSSLGIYSLYHPLYESYCWFLVCYDLYKIRFP